jgi:hypothetical protein
MIGGDSMEQTLPERPRAVTVIGWTWLALGVARVVNCVLGYVIWRVGGLDEGIPLIEFAGLGESLAAADPVFRNLGVILLVQGSLAAAIAFVAYRLLRLTPWARPAMEAVSWVAIVLLAGFVALFVPMWTEAVAREVPAPDAERMRLWGAVGVAGFALVGASLLGATIWFLRRPHVRRAFGARKP